MRPLTLAVTRCHVLSALCRCRPRTVPSSSTSLDSGLHSEGAAPPPRRRLLLHLTCTRAQTQRLERLGDEALRGRHAQHQQQLGVTTWWTRRRRRGERDDIQQQRREITRLQRLQRFYNLTEGLINTYEGCVENIM